MSLLATPAAARQTALTIVSTGPQGELAVREHSNEIRIVFSEPMVTLGRIPDVVTAPFVAFSPAIAGTFRWSGTTILIFTPDPERPLPYATTFEVTVSTAATAVSGRKLARPVSFRFTTPTVQLLRTTWYRRGGTVNGRVVVLMRFNQPVRPREIASKLNAVLERHEWRPPQFSPEEQARLRAFDPSALDRFNVKVRATAAIAAGGARVGLRLTEDWDRERFPSSPDLVVLETTAPLAPESWVRLSLPTGLRSAGGNVASPRPQEFTLQVEPAFFLDGFRCADACNADERNHIRSRSEIKVADFAAAISAIDITAEDPKPIAKTSAPRLSSYHYDSTGSLSLEDAGFDPQPPNRKYAVTARADLTSIDGQTLGYNWLGIVDNWHKTAFTSFGDGHGVWEKDGGSLLPFHARNMQNITQWVAPVQPSALMSTVLSVERGSFRTTPPGDGEARTLPVTPDAIQAHGLDLTPALQPSGTGLAWTAIEEGSPIARSRAHRGASGAPLIRSSLVQVTNLGVTVKDSPQNTLVFVTRLDTGAPVEGATVSIAKTDDSVHWRGVTDADGVAIAPDTPLRAPRRWHDLSFIVVAEKDGDVAYTASDWNEGILPWDFGTNLDLTQAVPLLRGSVFTDRGVYRIGEQVHFKAILRHNTPAGIRLLDQGTAIVLTTRDGENRVVDERTVRINEWSSTEWTMTLPETGSLGHYSVRARIESASAATAGAGADMSEDYDAYRQSVWGSFLVAAYRRPDFRVDVTLTGESTIAGDPLNGVVKARYLFGAPMTERPVNWRYTKSPAYRAPSTITETFGSDQWTFVGYVHRRQVEYGDIQRADGVLDNAGNLALDLATRRDAGVPYIYSLEGDVEDVSRQHMANRASVTVHPAPWYVGVRSHPYFIEQKNGLTTAVIAAGLDGRAVAGVPIDVTLTQFQWQSVRRAEGNGFYTWESTEREIPSGAWTITSESEPVSLDIPFATGGYFVLEATGRTDDGRLATTRTSFYVLGDGYTAWQRFDHNRIELVPERQTYKPGDSARIMIQSPWEEATALVTTEREGIRSHRRFALTSTQQSISVPITEDDIPNVYVSVLLIKGRTSTAVTEDDVSDPGKPAFRLGYVELQVEDRSKRLTVTVAANHEEYRPASDARVIIDVKDMAGRGTAGEVTLWAVDYGVLSLTSYKTPDVLDSVYVHKALQVMNADNRQRIVSRRVLTPKGATEGGGGGQEAGAGAMRKDFRVLAFWLGSVITDDNGGATVDVKLPESLTTYRIMAVAADRSSRFGSGETEVRTNKPLTLKAAFPRFLAVGDTAFFGAVVGSQLPAAGTAIVTMKSLDPHLLAIASPEQRIDIAARASLEVRFQAAAKAVGRARVQMTVQLAGERDAFEDVIPIEVLLSPETVAAHGEADALRPTSTETVTLPQGIVPGFGGVQFELSSTAMVGLGEGARYLVEYPYGCAEQKGSRALALLLAADLGDAFTLPDMDVAKMREAVQTTLFELRRYQCGTGGFAYWPGDCLSVSPYLTAYLLHVFKVASDLNYDVDAGMRARAYDYLEQQLAQPPPANESWWPSYTAWQAFAVKVLVEGGRTQDSNINRLYQYRDRMPVFAIAYLHDALLAKRENGGRLVDLQRRLLNAILPEAGSAHVEELNDPYLLWFWNSNIRSTAIVLRSLVKGQSTLAPYRQLVRWMMAVRRQGRWGNTQENAHAMEALVAYYRTFEAEVPDFQAIVRLGEQELARDQFQGRSTESTSRLVPMAELQGAGLAGVTRPLTFTRDGVGTLFYSARLRYAVDTLFHDGLDAGIQIARRYEPFVENGSKPSSTTYQAGELVRVTLTFRLTKERRFVAVTDPLPAGFEPVESWFDTTASALRSQTRRTFSADISDDDAGWTSWWRAGGFNHVERHDDRVDLFATRLSEGMHEFSYVVRATTAGSFRTAPARVEEMYAPEIFGRTATTVIEVKR